ncbi:hypothetical protein SAMD00019534_046440 [Acytostelium subglobosum LB1]|uniref:hypothetical protein n=1 Tax=Acytostelium subglobosum LB1 TaxID=1410327 RepID=UPI0006451859|nr:hypothetical protein SAMD00019534_046440 [Acytostelium subglobosum LB1]GAM21469.1 hypothetical protein SAMD00019534_046440 [Acytostelium subglobosum LB1]|eukprot:XP_012755588.1 hypothetical protein SAMD00019534_046440 [Acytostelium subglobosum LB1]
MEKPAALTPTMYKLTSEDGSDLGPMCEGWVTRVNVRNDDGSTSGWNSLRYCSTLRLLSD